jgi:hypothetical protein
LYDRSKGTNLAQFVSQEEDIREEPEEVDGETSVQDSLERTRKRLDSLTIESTVARLGPDEAIRLKYCLDSIHNVVGDSIPENIITAHIIQAKFDSERALDNVLSGAPIDLAVVLREFNGLQRLSSFGFVINCFESGYNVFTLI